MKCLSNQLVATAAGVLLVAMAVLASPTDQPKPAKPPEGGMKPLKVFILAGQSNMQGHAHVSTFDSMADDPKTAPLLKEMRGPGRQAEGVREGVDLVRRLPRRRLLRPAGEDGQTDGRVRRTGRQDRPGVHLRPDDGEAAGRADPHHQDGVGRAEPAHRLPPAERRARRRSTTSPWTSGRSGASTPRRRRKRSARTAACSTAT